MFLSSLLGAVLFLFSAAKPSSCKSLAGINAKLFVIKKWHFRLCLALSGESLKKRGTLADRLHTKSRPFRPDFHAID